MAVTPKKKPATTRKSASAATSAKKSTAKTAAAKVKPVNTPMPKVVQLVEPVVSAPEMKKKELVDLVVERTGIKKKDAKPSVEAALAVLGEALAAGRELNLQPLGKVKINRSKDLGDAKVLICKIRQTGGKAENDPADPLAEVSE